MAHRTARCPRPSPSGETLFPGYSRTSWRSASCRSRSILLGSSSGQDLAMRYACELLTLVGLAASLDSCRRLFDHRARRPVLQIVGHASHPEHGGERDRLPRRNALFWFARAVVAACTHLSPRDRHKPSPAEASCAGWIAAVANPSAVVLRGVIDVHAAPQVPDAPDPASDVHHRLHALSRSPLISTG